MSPRDATPLVVNPDLVRVVGSDGQVYLRDEPERTLELTADTFELLAALKTPRPLSELIRDPTPEQWQVVEQLISLRVLLRDDGRPSSPPIPRPVPAPLRLSGAPAWNPAVSEGGLVILGACCDDRTLAAYARGTAKGPEAIRRVSQQFRIMLGLEDGVPLGFPDAQTGRWLARGAELYDAGDLYKFPGCPLATYDEALAAAVAQIRGRGGRTIVLGGDHSATLAALRGHADRRIGVLHIDAHTDFGPVRHAEDLTHANVMRHVLALDHVDHIVLCGVRGFQGLPGPAEGVAHLALGPEQLRVMQGEERRSLLRSELPYYVSIDIDALDPSVAPATPVPEPDGFSVFELRQLLVEILAETAVVGGDVVEVRGADPACDLTARCALYVLFELLDRMQAVSPDA